MSCKEVVCDQQQAEEIVDLVSRMSMQFFYIGDLIVEEDDEVDPYVWLGSNSNFCPDPLVWEPRSLHHSAEAQNIEYITEEAEEEEYLVWGTQHESQDDNESSPEHPTDEDDVSIDGRLSGSTASDDHLDTHRTSGAERHATTDRGCFGR
jgi:hypothetical protein